MNHREGLDSSNVRVGVTGAIYSAPHLSQPAGPDGFGDITDAKNLGYVSEDGVTENRETSSEKLKAWQDNDVVRNLVTDGELSYTFTLIETKPETLEYYYGIKVDTKDGSISIDPTREAPRHALIIDVIDGDQVMRVVCPDAQVTEVGEQKYANGEPIGLEVTVSAYPTMIGDVKASAKKFYNTFKAGA